MIPFLSDPVLEEDTKLICRRMNPVSENLLTDNQDEWFQSLANTSLSEQEKQTWNQFPKKGHRRNEWLLGRIAAKDCVRIWALQKYNLDLQPTDIEIFPDSLGKPKIDCAILKSLGLIPDISISHCAAGILAVLHKDGLAIGIDYEDALLRKTGDWLERAFTSQELTLINTNDTTWLLALWTAKEAAAKASGKGLQGRWRDWAITQISKDKTQIQVTHKNLDYSVTLYQNETALVSVCYFD